MCKKLIYLLLLSVLTYACRKHDLPSPDTDVPGIPKEGINIQTSVFGRIVDEKDEPLSGVVVTGGGGSVITDVNGVFMLKDVMLDLARAYITATKPGFFNGSRIFRPMKSRRCSAGNWSLTHQDQRSIHRKVSYSVVSSIIKFYSYQIIQTLNYAHDAI